MSNIFEYHQGNSPLFISFPHDGTDIPADLEPKFNNSGMNNFDCDWYISKLYEFITDMDVSYIKPAYSRYVVDLNRSADGELLYPGKTETSICPLTTFDGISIYLSGTQPDKNEIQDRIETYWQPYHAHIQNELARIKSNCGHAILWDAHSIRREVPKLFDGMLPDLNFGTGNGTSCQPELIENLTTIAKTQKDYSVVLNERFKGGYITRHYGDPDNEINSVQLEINQSIYLKDSDIPKIDPEKTQRLFPLLQQLLESLIN